MVTLMITQSFLSIKEVAEQLGVEYKTIYRLIRRGELAAAKIGGVYRLRPSDVDAYIDQQVAATRQKALATQSSAVTEDTARLPPTRCEACFRLLSATQAKTEAATCLEPDCTAVICTSCWTQKQQYCQLHQPTLAEKLAAAELAQQSGQIPFILTALEARRRELNFCNRFERKIQTATEIVVPGSDDRLSLADGLYDHTVYDESTWTASTTPLPTHLPTNRRSRYTFLQQNNPLLIIEATAQSRLNNHLRDGFDTSPLTQEELMGWLLNYLTEAERLQLPWILGLAATSGWTQEAIDLVCGTSGGEAWVHHFLHICLIDLQTHQVWAASESSAIQPYLSFFNLLLVEEEVAAATNYIRKTLTYQSSMSASDIAVAVGVTPAAVRTAIQNLATKEDYFIEDIDGIGLVIAHH